MWAHAHGLVTIYHRGFIPVTEAEFRELFHQSALRMMLGLGSAERSQEVEETLAGLKAQLTA
jgi:hypothetical protein